MIQVEAGTVLGGKYRLESLIGRGGMGSVWRAEHLELRAPVAVKLLESDGMARTEEAIRRFHREARAAAAIRSAHVVQILDHSVDQATGWPFIVMELLEGESLAQRISRVTRISPAEAARIFTQVARALSRAHEAGIIHRDLKPDNVFLVRNDDDEVAKVLDFGIAKAPVHAISGDAGTATGTVMGTAYYMSPEQISGTKNVDFRTDLWALGVMVCECLTGQRPFDADTIGGLTLRICADPVPGRRVLALFPRASTTGSSTS
jgi:serine/threonine protein kinase